MYRPIVHYSLSYLIRSCPLVYTLSPYHHILPIPLIHYVSLAFTYYSILPYHTLLYHTLNYFTLPLLKLDRNDSWQKRLFLLGQIDLPSGDKADTTRRKWLMVADLPIFRDQVVLVTRDFCPRPGALWGAVLLFISYVWISKIHFKISIIHFWISIIHFWISKNEFRISRNNYGYFWISKNVKSCWILDIHKSIFGSPKNQCILGCPKIHFWISKNNTEFRISIIRFLDVHDSFLDIQKSVYFRISKNPFQKSCWI